MTNSERNGKMQLKNVLHAATTPGRRQRFVYAHRGGYYAYRTGTAQDDALARMHAEARTGNMHSYIHT